MSLARGLLLPDCLLDAGENLFRFGEVGESLAYFSPTLAPVAIDEENCVERDVLTAAASMEDAVLTDYTRAGVTQQRNLPVQFVPQCAGVFRFVHADTNDAGLDTVELLFVLCELAQFGGAVGSPVSAVEKYQNPGPAHGREAKCATVLIAQREFRRGLSLG
jgi:hypothetical protein